MSAFDERVGEVNRRIGGVNERIDKVDKRIDESIGEVNKHIDERINGVNERIGEVDKRIIAIQKSFGRLEAGPTVEPASSRRGKTFRDKYTELREEVFLNTRRIDEINKRLDRLYEVIVRRDEHDKLESRVIYLEQQLNEIKLKLAA